ncbi:hypothetical protein GF362_04780 [Candidatus Dojkabacteria bacterium]|nr:hypothetical protein [Candidatus Dojkabacteria bacterium]
MKKIGLNRIYGIILRHTFQSMHSITRMMDTIFWPVIDLLLWGLTSKYIESSTVSIPNILLMVVSGIIFWMLVYRNQNMITVSMLEDFWNRSFMHYFVAPVKFWEYILGTLLFALSKLGLTFVLSIFIAFILYQTNLFVLGFSLIPFILNLLLTGWWVGFLVMGIILRYGSKVEILAWSFVAILSPFSAVYYPIEILPMWAQNIATLIPTSYIFEGMREVINEGILDWNKIIISFMLNTGYLILTLIYLKYCYKKVLNKGLVKVF